MQYPKKLQGLLTRLQKFLLGIDEGKNTAEGFATYIKSKTSCHLDLKFYINFKASSYFSLHDFYLGCFADIAKN